MEHETISSTTLFPVPLTQEPLSVSEAADFGARDQALNPSPCIADMQNDLEVQQQSFQQAIQLYQAKTAGTKYQAALDIDAKHSWEEVLVSIDDASKQYTDCAGRWGKLRKALRRVGKVNTMVEAWSQLLPGQSAYFSILCGGLKLIFGAAGRLQDLREEIAEALEEIPVLMAVTRKATGLLRNSEDVKLAAIDLYVTTLAALEHIVRWYTRTAPVSKWLDVNTILSSGLITSTN